MTPVESKESLTFSQFLLSDSQKRPQEDFVLLTSLNLQAHSEEDTMATEESKSNLHDECRKLEALRSHFVQAIKKYE